MSLIVRMIPCLNVNNGRIVKRVDFENFRGAGDPAELTRRYGEEGADELTLLDVVTPKDGRDTMLDVVRRTASEISTPLTVGGGMHNVEDVDQLPRTGAGRASVNTAAIVRLELFSELLRRLSAQCVVLSVDACRVPEGGTPQPSGFEATTHGNSYSAGVDAVEWTRRGEGLGIGKTLLSSMDDDDTEGGFDLELLEKVYAAVDVSVIASGGTGRTEHLPLTVHAGANAVLAASIFHFGEAGIAEVKEEMAREGVEVHQ